MVVVSFEGSNQAFFTTDYTDLLNEELRMRNNNLINLCNLW